MTAALRDGDQRLVSAGGKASSGETGEDCGVMCMRLIAVSKVRLSRAGVCMTRRRAIIPPPEACGPPREYRCGRKPHGGRDLACVAEFAVISTVPQAPNPGRHSHMQPMGAAFRPRGTRNRSRACWSMEFQRLLVGLADACVRRAKLVVAVAALVVVFAGVFAAGHLGISTDTDEMFAKSLPWRQRALQFKADFPQLSDLLVIVVSGKIPEERKATAAALAKALAADHAHFRRVTRPDASAFLRKEGLLFLDPHQLEDLLNRT